MKKSLEAAHIEAQGLSVLAPDILFRVMDKSGKKAVCTGSEWIYRERVLEGYCTVATYKNGMEV